MTHLVYIGNQLSQNNKTATAIDTLSGLLRLEHYKVFTASNKKNKMLRLLDMLFCILKNRKQADYVLIDTYSTSNFYYAFFCSQFCRILKLKYLPVLHGGNLPDRLKSNPKLSEALFNNAHTNIAPSLYMKSIFNHFGYENVVYIPNAIELKNYPFKKRGFDTLDLLWVRSFSKIYNPNLAIDILFNLKQQGFKATLCMVGPENDGSLKQAKEYAKTLNVEVIFTGKLSKPEWITLSKDYNIFINTTNFDNIPVSVMEAMALGLPIISTNVGGMPFLIDHEKDGILVNPNNADAFVHVIKKLQSNPDKANDIALKARKKTTHFDWDLVKKKWLSVLR